MLNLRLIGISYKNTPLQLRGKLSFDEQATKSFYRMCSNILDLKEIMILSTCNRFEIYFHGSDDLGNQLIKLLGVHTGIESIGKNFAFTRYEHIKALEHLIRVGVGLESKVLGDIQIINQVKTAYQWAVDENMVSPIMHRALHTLFYSHKRVVQETNFRNGRASLASVSSDLTRKYIKSIEKPTLLLLGLGEIGLDVVKNLQKIDAEVLIINRTDSKAISIAETYGFKAIPFQQFEMTIQKADVIISAIRTPKPIITANLLHNCPQQKLLIDLSVPMSVSPKVNEISHVSVINVDQLEGKTNETLQSRKSDIPAVEVIIEESLLDLVSWSQSMEISPIINQFKEALESIRQNELARYTTKVDQNHARLLDKATKNIINKIVKMPVLKMKSSCKREEVENLSEVLKKLFNLEQREGSLQNL